MITVDSQVIRNTMVRCELCDARSTLDAADLAGWDWFTGSLKRTFHYCPKHCRSSERNSAFEKSRKSP